MPMYTVLVHPNVCVGFGVSTGDLVMCLLRATGGNTFSYLTLRRQLSLRFFLNTKTWDTMHNIGSAGGERTAYNARPKKRGQYT